MIELNYEWNTNVHHVFEEVTKNTRILEEKMTYVGDRGCIQLN